MNNEAQTETQNSISKRLLWQVEKLSPSLEELPIGEHVGVLAALQLFNGTPEAVRQKVLARVELLAAKLDKVPPEDADTVLGLLAALCKARSIDEQRHEAAQRALAIR